MNSGNTRHCRHHPLTMLAIPSISVNLTPPNSPPPPPPATSDHHTHLLSLLTHRTPLSHIKQIHAQTLRTLPTLHHLPTLFLFTRILHFSSFHDLRYCSRIFSQIQTPNSFVYNTLIRAYAVSPQKPTSLAIYRQMIEHGIIPPDRHTFPFVLKACSYLFDEISGMQIHAHLLKLGFESDVHINNSLIHFYSSCGILDCARKVFDKMPERSCVSWNAMIDAIVASGELEEGLRMFIQMQEQFKPDGYTLQSVLSACAGIGSLSLGMWAHAYFLRFCPPDPKNDVLVNNSVIQMYCQCGALTMAEQVFQRMPKRDVNSWNSVILGSAIHGEASTSLDHFHRMIEEDGIVPNSITFVGILTACNYRGMVDQGRAYFNAMVNAYNIEPRLEHYGCLIDLLARAGNIHESLTVVSQMPMKPDAVIWRSLLDACCRKNNIKLGEELAGKALDSEQENLSGVYVLLSKIYSAAARWNDVGLVRKMMVKKEPGCSSIEVGGVWHEFFAGDTAHAEREGIYGALDAIDGRLKEVGYEVGGEGRLHSERLAMAFGLMHRKGKTTIRVFKNLRVCRDCHEVSKMMSKVFDVEIVVRDRVRFHRFRDGSRSCVDYW